MLHTCPDCGGDYTGDACPDCAEDDQYDEFGDDEYDDENEYEYADEDEDDDETYTCPACGKQTYSLVCQHCGVYISIWSGKTTYEVPSYYQQQNHRPGRTALILLSIALSITIFLVIPIYSLGACNTSSSSISNEKVQKELSGIENSKTELTAKNINSPAGVSSASNGAARQADTRAVIKAHEETAEEKLLKRLKSGLPNGSAIAGSYADDFNKDGKPGLFALVNKGKDSGDDILGGEVWYVSDTVTEKMLEAGIYRNSTAVWDVGGQKLFRAEEGYGGSGSVSHVWSVRDGKPYELKYAGEGLEYVGDQQFYTYPGAFDLMRDGSGGHTWKRYYLYFDKTTGMFKEYGGISISKAELLKLKNAAGILNKINKKGLKITDIFYRSNGIININYIDEICNLNLTLIVKDDTVSLAAGNDIENPGDTQGGVYKAAIFEKIATYPDKFIK